MLTLKKFFQILTPGQRRSTFVQLALMFVGMLLETASIGLVIPAVALMTQDDLAASYPSLGPWLAYFGNPSHERLVGAGMAGLTLLYAARSGYLAFLAWYQARYVFGLQAHLSERLFVGYLHQPYAFHLQRNSAVLIRNVMAQVGNLIIVIRQIIILTTEVMVLVGISAVLLSVEPLGAGIVVSVLGTAGWTFNRLTRRHIRRWGTALQEHEGQRIRHLQQGLGGVKDVKLLGREAGFVAQYATHNQGSAVVSMRQGALVGLPRLMLEFMAVAGLAALVLTMVMQQKPVDAIVPTLGVFAAAAFRLMPSFGRVTEALGGILYYLPVIDNLHAEVRLLDRAVVARDTGAACALLEVLKVDRVSFQYDGAGEPAIRDVSLEIRRGMSVGLVGGSGAGKSTLVDIILGLLVPTSGAVEVDGVNIFRAPRSWQDHIGYVPQNIFLTDDTLRRNVAFGILEDEIDDVAVGRAIRAAQLETLVRDLPDGLETVVGERGVRLSGGQRQRIGIARALYSDPPVLVLDEATSSLDSATEQGVMTAIKALRGDKTIIIVAHRLSTIEHCDWIFRFEQGSLVDQGSADEVLDRVRALLGSEESDEIGDGSIVTG